MKKFLLMVALVIGAVGVVSLPGTASADHGHRGHGHRGPGHGNFGYGNFGQGHGFHRQHHYQRQMPFYYPMVPRGNQFYGVPHHGYYQAYHPNYGYGYGYGRSSGIYLQGISIRW